MRPVRRTSSPSRIMSDSPMSTQPTPSSSRLSARPKTSCGNATISPAITRSRPNTRAMPSPTDTTVPTSAISTEVSRPWICRRRMSVISSTLICMPIPLSPAAAAKRRTWASQRTVEDRLPTRTTNPASSSSGPSYRARPATRTGRASARCSAATCSGRGAGRQLDATAHDPLLAVHELAEQRTTSVQVAQAGRGARARPTCGAPPAAARGRSRSSLTSSRLVAGATEGTSKTRTARARARNSSATEASCLSISRSAGTPSRCVTSYSATAYGRATRRLTAHLPPRALVQALERGAEDPLAVLRR